MRAESQHGYADWIPPAIRYMEEKNHDELKMKKAPGLTEFEKLVTWKF